MSIKRSKPNILHSQRHESVETHLSPFIAHFQCKRTFLWHDARAFDQFHIHFLIAMDNLLLLLLSCLQRVHDFIEKHSRKCLRSKVFRSVHPLIISFAHHIPHQHIRTSHAKITFYHSRRVLNYFSFNYIVHRKYISSVARLAWHNSLSARICMPSLSLPLSLSIILCCHNITLH